MDLPKRSSREPLPMIGPAPFGVVGAFISNRTMCTADGCGNVATPSASTAATRRYTFVRLWTREGATLPPGRTPMTIGQNLEALRVQLGAVHRELFDLVLTSPFALPSPNSVKHDEYVRKLSFVEERLRGMERSFFHMKRQGAPFYGSSDDRFKAKQREASFRDQVAAVETILALCFEELAALLEPNRRGVIKGIADFGKKADETLKMLKGDPRFSAEVGHGGPQMSAPSTAASVDASVSSFLTIAIVVVAAVKKVANRAKQ